MKIIVVGSGGIGGYFGGKLSKAGEDVTFVARGAHFRTMKERGLRIRSALEGEWQVDAPVVDTLKGQPHADIVLFCVKSCDTEEAAEMARPVIGPHTGILSLQNGVDNEDKIADILGAGHVLGGVAYIFANIEAPGVIAHHQLGRIVFGEMSGELSGRANAFLDACKRASIQAELIPDIRRMLWEKYAFLTALAGTTALIRLPVRYIRDVPETRRLWQLQIEELLQLAKADKVDLGEDMMQKYVSFLESLAPTNYSSLYQDLVQGKRLELEALHGYAVKLGERYRVPTPTLFAVYAGLRPYGEGTPSPGTVAQ